jgi:predicted  nucleic acid-binding Zn-ribbon protein
VEAATAAVAATATAAGETADRLAAVPDLARLLDVQDRDLTLDQLAHRRSHLPERAALTAATSDGSRLDAELGDVQTRLHDIELAQRKLEDEITAIDTKAAAETKKLNSGTITAPREIQALSDEIDALGRRKRALEDDELELMEQAEPLAADVERLTAERAAVTAELERLTGVIAEQEASIDGELVTVRAERDAAAADLDAALLDRYEKLRSKLGGVAVARLQGDMCLGCHVSLPAMEVDKIRHSQPDTIVTHEECGRILVR